MDETRVHKDDVIAYALQKYKGIDHIYHFHDPDSGASRRASGCITSEDSGCEGNPDLYCGKYYSDPVYSAFYQADI